MLVKFATHLDSRASMQLFDVIDTADEAMHAFIDLPQARTRQLLAAVGKGEAGGEMVKQQQRWDADLVVVGKTGSSAWTDWTPRQCCGKPMALW